MSGRPVTEIWRTIQEFPAYEVSNFGRVKRTAPPIRTPGGIIKLRLNTSGYAEVTLKHQRTRKRRQVHRLLALAFLPMEPGRPEINHRNGIRHDNLLGNLEWVAHKENMMHAYHVLNGNALKGEACPHAKLTADNVVAIRKLLHLGVPQAEIGHMFGVSQTAIYYIKSGRSWVHVPS